ELVLEKDFPSTGSYSAFVLGNAGRVYLEEGVHPVTVTNGGGSLYFRHFCIEYLRDVEITEVVANDETTVLESGSTVSRGVDSFDIKFNQEVKEDTVKNATVKLISGEDELSADVLCSGETATLNLKETLDFSKEYKLSIDGVYDKFGYTQIENAEYIFKTSDSSKDFGSALFEVQKTIFDERSMKIEGKMLSSAGVPISGRKIELYAISPSGVKSTTPECTAVSGIDGNVVLTGELKEGCESGLYKLDLDYEYKTESLFVEMVYVSETKEQELAEALKKANSVEDIEDFFEANAVMFGFDLEEDTKDLDESLLYAYFKDNKPETFNEIREDYYKYLNMEKINQASAKKQIADILADEEACVILGIIKGKIELVVDYKTMMLEEIFNLSPIRDEEKFDEKLSEIIEKYYAKEFNVSSPNAETEGDNVDKGQTIYIDLAFSEKVDNITGAIFTVEVDDAEILEGCIVEAKSPFDAKISVKGNIAEVTFEADTKVDGVLKMGEFGIVNTEKEGKWNVTIGGKVSIEVEADYDVIVPIIEDSAEVSAKANNKKPSGGVSSSPSGSGRGNGGGTITQKPEIEPAEPDAPKNKYEFNDIDGVEWAKES
ncbi:MAG: hypothetical protein IKV88_00065, partial [Clostridia bacterium]|nr:hypothetical protein [Clostridia bacterium]